MSLKDSLAFSSTDEEKKKAFDSFLSLDFPTIKNEEWKFTNVSKIIKNDFKSTEGSIDDSIVEKLLENGIEGDKIVLINGIFSKKLSRISNQVCEIKSLNEAVSNNATIFSKWYNKILPKNPDAFTSLNTAMNKDGVFIYIPKNKTATSPISIHLFQDAQAQHTISHPRNLIYADENSEATVLNFYHTIGTNKSLINEVTEIGVEKDARLNYYKIQNDTIEASQVNTTQVYQAEKSLFKSHTFSLSGELIRNNLNIVLGGEYIESHMNGLYMLEGTTHVDNHTIADHQYPNCESHELYKGVMDEKSNGVFNGKIFVRKDAQKTNAFQSNKNILLSDLAKVNTKPQLEIWADDVSCSHGCTTGQLDEEALFYLMARGISAPKAKALLLNAFAGEVLDRISLPILKEQLESIIIDRLQKV